MKSSLELMSSKMLPKIEYELRDVISLAAAPDTEELHGMIAYHMGWENGGSETTPGSKRIRPLLLLLTTGAAG